MPSIAKSLLIHSVAIFCFGTFVTSRCDSVFAQAARPTAPQLFPKETLIYGRVNDSRELRDKLEESNIGRLGNDPKLKPILDTFYNSFAESIQEQLMENVGIDLNEMLSIPNGELAFALLPGERDPIVCILLEAGDELPAVEILLDRLQETFERRGAQKEESKVSDIEIVQWRDPNRESRQMGYFIDSGVIVLTSKADMIEELAKTWTGNAIDFTPLSENRQFTNIMSQCVGSEGERPQISFYLDPIAMVRTFSRNSGGGAMVAAMLGPLGVDGIKGLGGSIILVPNGFDSISHFHVAIESPRRGVLQVLRPASGEIEPESWVSDDVVSYFTANWDFAATIKEIEKLVDQFQGPGAFAENALAAADRVLGVNVQEDLIDNLANRATIFQSIAKPAKLNSGSNLYAFHLKDGTKMKSDVLPKVYDALREQNAAWSDRILADCIVYELELGSGTDAIRAPRICMTVIDDCFLIADSSQALEQAIYTDSGQNALLRDSLDFQIVRDKMTEQLGERETSIISFQRPEESLRLFYDLAADRNNVDRLRSMAESNPLFAALVKSLDENQLPPFEVIAKYLAPSGAFVYEDDTGIHATSFSMARE